MKPPKKTPCAECPMRRVSAPGWLGAAEPEAFIDSMHNDQPMPCHLAVDYEDPQWMEKLARVPQCSGQAIYLSNVCLLPRPGANNARTLPADRVRVFASRAEFLAHHTSRRAPKKRAPKKLTQKGELACAYPECGAEVTDEDLCFGCGFYTCGKHSPHAPCGNHEVVDHWIENEDGL